MALESEILDSALLPYKEDVENLETLWQYALESMRSMLQPENINSKGESDRRDALIKLVFGLSGVVAFGDADAIVPAVGHIAEELVKYYASKHKWLPGKNVRDIVAQIRIFPDKKPFIRHVFLSEHFASVQAKAIKDGKFYPVAQYPEESADVILQAIEICLTGISPTKSLALKYLMAKKTVLVLDEPAPLLPFDKK